MPAVNQTTLGSLVPVDGATGVPTSIGTLGSGTLAELNAAITDADVFPDKTPITVDAGVARTLSDADNGTLIRFTSAVAVTVTVPATLTKGVSIALEQAGAGQVSLVGGGTLTLEVTASAVAPPATLDLGAVIALTMIDDTAAAEVALIYGNLA